ncbi:hypothetical protein P152DRAFT_458851 [Eremomyces bilateralis CBS 781.70]|uniref:Uncharacterized protein n=1 Tax=Eremomyces bilateralis CBS 781.70 TaxID=1392243 RepID=A0A6G1G1B0_9PEZI|nr:uncharacterized protein P152DRAFT_458851 [Eremomyces bilateralis CBS 781.70]KAF1811895.1 hypothetical protein P152DRAFT_458851 [Eremomyces bilateralis CBS 781.70]
MASVVLVVGAAIYFTAEKVHERREKKRVLKAQEDLQYGVVEFDSITDNTTVHDETEPLPAYNKATLPPYHMEDQHPAFKSKKQSERSSHRFSKAIGLKR